VSSQEGPSAAHDPEAVLAADQRLRESVDLFNAAAWYPCHDGFEALWHETDGPMRAVLQGILQIAVAHIHLERGNLHGATVLIGEGLGRLSDAGDRALGLDLGLLRLRTAARLAALQAGQEATDLAIPRLEPAT